MEKKFTSRETAMLKRVYQNVDANYQKVKKLTFKRNELQKEIDSLMEEIELTDAPVVKKFGYSSVDLVKKVINPLFNEDGSPKCDKDGHPIKQTKYVLIYPDTIIPPVVEEEAKEETGLKEVLPVINEILGLNVLTVNGHIKNDKYVSSHLHLSIAYLLEANEDDELIINEEETNGVKWIPINELHIHCNEPYIVKTVYDKFNKKIKELSL